MVTIHHMDTDINTGAADALRQRTNRKRISSMLQIKKPTNGTDVAIITATTIPTVIVTTMADTDTGVAIRGRNIPMSLMYVKCHSHINQYRFFLIDIYLLPHEINFSNIPSYNTVKQILILETYYVVLKCLDSYTEMFLLLFFLWIFL